MLSSCVVGLPDDDLGARVHAIVQLGRAMSDGDLRAHVRPRLTGTEVASTFERVDHPRRDDTGKIRRSALRAERLETATVKRATGHVAGWEERAVGYPEATP